MEIARNLPQTETVSTTIRREKKRILRKVGEYAISKLPSIPISSELEDEKVVNEISIREKCKVTLYGLFFIMFFTISYFNIIDEATIIQFSNFILSKVDKLVVIIQSFISSI